MGLLRAKLGTFVIPDGGTNSNILAQKMLSSAGGLVFVNDASYDDTVVVYAGPDITTVQGDMLPLREDGATADVTLIAGKQQEVNMLPGAQSLMLVAGSAQSGDKSVDVFMIISVTE